MENVWLLVYCLLCFGVVKYVLYRLKYKNRLQKAEHPLAQAQKYYDRIRRDNLYQKCERFPSIIQEQISNCSMKNQGNVIKYTALLVAILELHNNENLLKCALQFITNLQLDSTINGKYLQSRLEKYNIVAYNRQL